MRAISPTYRVYDPDDLPEILAELRNLHKLPLVRNKYNQKFYNVPVSFDIETTSFYIDEYCISEKERNRRREHVSGYNPPKYSTMYVWQLAIWDYVIMGRTWDEFLQLLQWLHMLLHTETNRRLVVYVHNLEFEMQFLRKHLQWKKIFADGPRSPIYGYTTDGIEFRCSYKLSGYSLEKVAENLTDHDIRKLKGDLDYSLLRTSATPLTESEIGYCVNDVLILTAYIEEEIKRNHGIHRIPLTQTGYARRHCRDKCLTDTKENPNQNREYRQYINRLTMDPEEFNQARRGFQGGFTHASATRVPFIYEGVYHEKIWYDVWGLDFTSAYPAVIVQEQFPVGPPELCDVSGWTSDEFYRVLRCYCCVFDVILYNLESTFGYEHYISESRCSTADNATVDNGRIVRADRVCLTVTEIDWYIIKKTYRWSGNVKIGNFRRWRKGYLPKPFVQTVLELYRDKTNLKDVEGKEEEYMHAKQLLNSLYGMMVTNPVHDIYAYDYGKNKWLPKETPELDKALKKYNDNKGRFTYFLWGIYVTALCRQRLWATILTFKEDYIYTDTDSIKFVNLEKHREYIDRFNAVILERNRKSAEHYGFDLEMYQPVTPDGRKKPLGVWDLDMHAYRFKTEGAKRYLYQDKKGLHLTVAGLGKSTIRWMIDQCGGYTGHAAVDDMINQKVFSMFRDGMTVPAGDTGKMTHTYIDDERSGEMTDYTGVTAPWHELSCIHLEGASYEMGLSDDFVSYLSAILFSGGGEET